MNGLDLQPSLSGDLIDLRPLRPEDWADLYAVASDPLIWEQHPDPDRWREERFRKFFAEALASKGALVAVERGSGRIIGSSRFFWSGPEELEIGWTFLGRDFWGRGHNREMKRLMLDHAFQGVRRVVFYIGPENFRSRRAVEKIGAVLTERRMVRPVQGKPVDHLIYQIGPDPHA